jgi:tol-pal system protein YbgF
MEDQAKRQQQDYDLRFRDLEQSRGGASRPAQGSTTPSPQNTPSPAASSAAQAPGARPRSDAFDPNQGAAAPGAPRPLTPGAGGSADLQAPLDVTRNPRPNTVAVPQTGPTGDARMDFEAARTLLTQGSHEQAEFAFRDFLKTHPRDRRVADAYFFIGESFLNRTRYREAAEQYLTVTTKHSNSNRAPEAMLKLGIALRGLGARQEACGTFEQVPKKYPKVSSAIRAAIEREKVRAQC